jgi:ABC-type branched-subunit amino acid transport system ATPase component
VLKPAKPINMTDHIREVVATDIHEIRAIIGPNGAGKSSMLNCISGV